MKQLTPVQLCRLHGWKPIWLAKEAIDLMRSGYNAEQVLRILKCSKNSKLYKIIRDEMPGVIREEPKP